MSLPPSLRRLIGRCETSEQRIRALRSLSLPPFQAQFLSFLLVAYRAARQVVFRLLRSSFHCGIVHHSIAISEFIASLLRWSRQVPGPLSASEVGQDLSRRLSLHITHYTSKMADLSRRRVLDTLNSRYLYGRVVRGRHPCLYHPSSGVFELRCLLSQCYCTRANSGLTCQPLLHAIILTIQMIIMSRLVAKFNSYYADKPSKPTIYDHATPP